MKNVIITGGSGTFGNAFARRLLTMDIERIVIFSRDEVKQAEMREQFTDKRMRFFIGDVRDRDRLRRAFQGVDTVVHAAALKRIEVGHYNPGEMVKTNILGAMNVIEAAHDAGVQKVVALSTDKACEPVSAYGQSKALAETLFLAANNSRGESGPLFSVTRYGNVAFSRGSVIPRWLDAGQVVTVTDPDATRFWMTIDQAVDLVLATIRDMPDTPAIPFLPAYRLGDLAAAMHKQVRVTGLPAWEKRHESMRPGESSDLAPRMTVEDLRAAIQEYVTETLRAAA